MRLVRPSVPQNIGISGVDLEPYPLYPTASTINTGDRIIYQDPTLLLYWIYESLIDANTQPLTDPASWLLVGAANPSRMFDDVSNSQSTATGTISVTFDALPLANTVALLNCVGTDATVTITVDGLGTVFTETKSFVQAGDGVGDWYEYFFGDVSYRSDLIFTDLPSYADQHITVSVTPANGQTAIGTLAIGLGNYLGDTVFPTREGLIDYSRKEADAFGKFTVVERPFSKRGNFTFLIDQERVAAVKNLLPNFRAKACVWIVDDDDGSSAIYGFYKDYEIGRSDENSPAVATIELEGLS